jgi:hypothetical protein
MEVTAEKIDRPANDSLRLQFGRHKNATGVLLSIDSKITTIMSLTFLP